MAKAVSGFYGFAVSMPTAFDFVEGFAVLGLNGWRRLMVQGGLRLFENLMIVESRHGTIVHKNREFKDLATPS